MDEIVEKLHSLLFSNLVLSSPVLSGNMKSMISTSVLDPGEREVVIDAPYYDLEKWETDGIIIWTGESFDGVTAYARDVNEYGGFNTHNKSEGWVTRSIIEVVNTIAGEVGAEVIYDI